MQPGATRSRSIYRVYWGWHGLGKKNRILVPRSMVLRQSTEAEDRGPGGMQRRSNPAVPTMIRFGAATLLAIPMCLALLCAQVLAFEVQCTLPFEEIKRDNPAVASCPLHGSATESEQQGQNRAKNNLCATGNSVNLTFQHFIRLQKAAEEAEIPFGSHNRVPEDRTVLNNLIAGPGGVRIGEGTIVRYVGFVSHPRYSNRSKGEAVNCKTGGAEHNDIHLDLVRSSNEPACKSITAEIIPHFRPAAWEVDILKLAQFKDHPMRFTGQLFFDASHRPCRNDSDKVAPKRASIWEIHPVYAIDVCKFKSLNQCRASNRSVWTPLADMVNTEDDED